MANAMDWLIGRKESRAVLAAFLRYVESRCRGLPLIRVKENKSIAVSQIIEDYHLAETIQGSKE